MAMVAGVDVAPSGDGGPAGSIPAMWGFREFDAFLLVVDDVPWGGAFNPSLSTIDFTNVERIEVMRGSAPVMYGATSFVGVIHVIHYAAGKSPKVAGLSLGHRGSVLASGSTVLSGGPDLGQTLTANVERHVLAGERNEFTRGQASYRAALPLGPGRAHFDGTLTELRQSPTQSVRRRGIAGVQRLADDVGPTPFDANHNPSDGRVDGRRYTFTGGYELALDFAKMVTTLSYTRSEQYAIRGFLTTLAGGANAATGFTAQTGFHDVYLDSHLEIPVVPELNLVAGVDYLFGAADLTNTIYTYTVNGDGSAAQSSAQGVVTNINALSDQRNFSGVYTQATWNPVSPLTVLFGLRLNVTSESLQAQKDLADPTTAVNQFNNETRLSGMAGLSLAVWRDGADHLTLYGDYRDTYKPFALDMEPKVNAVPLNDYRLLAPEEAYASEAGLRGALLNGDVDYEISFFQLDFTNAANFAPGVAFSRTDGARLRFRGMEVETGLRLRKDFRGIAHWAYHDSRFLSANTDDGTSVSGNRVEMIPITTAGFGLLYSPPQGFNASVTSTFTGRRFLNKKNTGPITSFFTGDVSVGYRWQNYSWALSGTNLSDQRDAVSESEFSESTTGGAAAYYRYPAREVTATFGIEFK